MLYLWGCLHLKYHPTFLFAMIYFSSPELPPCEDICNKIAAAIASSVLHIPAKGNKIQNTLCAATSPSLDVWTQLTGSSTSSIN